MINQKLIILVFLNIILGIYCNPNFIKTQKSESEIQYPVLGIDFGQDTIEVAIFEKQYGSPIFIPQLKNTPAVIAFLNDGKIKVGEEALQLAKQQESPESINVIYGLKRLLGMEYENNLQLQTELKYLPFRDLIVQKDKKPQIQITKSTGEVVYYEIEQAIGFMLQQVKLEAEKYYQYKKTEESSADTPEEKLQLKQEYQFSGKIEDVVISIPSSYNNAQRIAIKNAAFYAGFSFSRLFSETGSILLSHLLDQQASILDQSVMLVSQKQQSESEDLEVKSSYLVFDLGAGKIDFSFGTFVNNTVQIPQTTGNTYLGILNFDRKLIDFYADQINQDLQIDIFQDSDIYNQLFSQVKKARKVLQKQQEYEIHINIGQESKKYIITQEKYLEINQQNYEDVLWNIESLISRIKNDYEEVDFLLLSGKGTKLPKLKEKIQQIFKGTKTQIIDIEKQQDGLQVAKGTSILGQKLLTANIDKKQQQQQQKINIQQEQTKQNQQSYQQETTNKDIRWKNQQKAYKEAAKKKLELQKQQKLEKEKKKQEFEQQQLQQQEQEKLQNQTQQQQTEEKEQKLAIGSIEILKNNDL